MFFRKKEYLGIDDNLRKILKLLKEKKASCKYFTRGVQPQGQQNYKIILNNETIEISWSDIINLNEFEVDGVKVNKKHYEYDTLIKIKNFIYDIKIKENDIRKARKFKNLSDKLDQICSKELEN